MDTYYQQALADYEAQKRANRERRQANWNQAKDIGKTIAKTTKTTVVDPTKKLVNYLGFGGTTGGLIGFSIAGPVGGLVGIVAGKNSKEIYGGVKTGITETYDFFGDARAYEELNPDATFQRGRETNYLKDLYGRFTSKIDNARKYQNLENLATEISQSTGRKVSPEEAYQIQRGLEEQRALAEERQRVEYEAGVRLTEAESIKQLRKQERKTAKAYLTNTIIRLNEMRQRVQENEELKDDYNTLCDEYNSVVEKTRSIISEKKRDDFNSQFPRYEHWGEYTRESE